MNQALPQHARNATPGQGIPVPVSLHPAVLRQCPAHRGWQVGEARISALRRMTRRCQRGTVRLDTSAGTWLQSGHCLGTRNPPLAGIQAIRFVGNQIRRFGDGPIEFRKLLQQTNHEKDWCWRTGLFR